jgi:phosphoglycolate phosphatase-like HAD superfamily hydrolase
VIRYLIWDVDGTLFDTYPALARAVGAALRDLGAHASSDWIESLARKSLSYCMSTLAGKFKVKLEELERGFERHYTHIPLREQAPFPGVVGICEYVCSIGGMNVIVTHRGRESTMGLLAAHDMTPYFEDSVTGADGYPRKPNPAAFEAMIGQHGLRREETLAVGDREIDILAGQAAGVRTCLFGAQLEEVTADYRIVDYADLHRLLLAENDASGSQG